MIKKILGGILVVGLLVTTILPFTPVSAAEPIDTSLSSIDYEGIDNEFVPAVAPWDWQMLDAPYHTRVKEDFTAGQILEFEIEGSTVQLQPMALEWTNDYDQIQQVSMPQSTTPTITNPDHQGTITWDNAYGSNIDFEWKCTPIRLNKTLTISGLNDLPPPAQYIQDGGNPVLRLNLIFDPSSDVGIYVNDQLWDKNSKQQTFDVIEFRRDGEVLWNFMPLMYWDSVGNEGQSVATVEKRGQSLYISIRVPYEWLQTAVYPVFIDADVTIDNSVFIDTYRASNRGGIFWTTTLIGYVIYLDDGGNLVWSKTIDGGDNWSAANEIVPTLVVSYDCWADWQTAGDVGTKIHIACVETATDTVMYAYLDTNDDSEGTDTIEAAQGTGLIRTSLGMHYVSITKTRGGNLAVAFRYTDTLFASFYEFYTSPDGDAWTSEASPWEAAGDYILLFPANLADADDLWAVFWDISDDEISLMTYDDSGNSWSEQLISASMTESIFYLQMDGAIRLSDGHLLLVAWSEFDTATADLMVWDINGAASITAKANVLTDSAESFLVSVFINQVNDDIYVAYTKGTAVESLVAVFYQLSQNGGTNWDGQTAMQADAEDDERWISAGAVKATWGGKFQPVWFNLDLFDLFTNTDNGILIAALVAPTIDTVICSGFGRDWAIVNGIVTDDGGSTITTAGFNYGLTDAYGSDSTKTVSLNTGDEFWVKLTGLTAGTVYHFQAKATNGGGEGTGSDMVFSTEGSLTMYEYLNTGGDAVGDDIYAGNWAYMQFTVGAVAHSLDFTNIYVIRTGAAPGDAVLSIRHADVADKPTGADLDVMTLDADLFSVALDWVRFDFPNDITLEAGESYALVLRCPTGTVANYLEWRWDAGGSLASAIAGKSADSGITWTAEGTADYLFENWGEPVFEVVGAEVFTGYRETGDWLVVFTYRNYFTPYYMASICRDNFYVRLLDDTTVIAQIGCPAWGYRPGSFYFSKALADTMEWGVTDYKVRLYGDFGAFPYSDYNIAAADWGGAVDPFLDAWVIQVANIIGDDLGIALTETIADKGEVLNAIGHIWFSIGIPYLNEIRPELFEQVSQKPPYEEEDYTHALQGETVWTTRVGTQIATTLTTAGGLFGLDGDDFGGILFVIAFLGVAGLLTLGGHLVIGLGVGYPILLAGAWFGLLSWVIVGVITFLAVAIFVYKVWLTK